MDNLFHISEDHISHVAIHEEWFCYVPLIICFDKGLYEMSSFICITIQVYFFPSVFPSTSRPTLGLYVMSSLCPLPGVQAVPLENDRVWHVSAH